MGLLHSFIFKPGEWVGEGKISFSSYEEQLYFMTKWKIDKLRDDGIACLQEVRMEGAEESVMNHFMIYDVTEGKFNITLENAVLGLVDGVGVMNEKSLGWEFRGGAGFEGFEVYHLEEEGRYKFHAEYTSDDNIRTLIDGTLRKSVRPAAP